MDIKSNNGIIDKFRFSSLQKYMDKILKIKKKYDLPNITLKVDDTVDIEFDDENKVCYIQIYKYRVIRYSYHHIFNNIKVILTVGVSNNSIHFVTENKHYTNKETIKDLERKLKNFIPKLQEDMNRIEYNGILYTEKEIDELLNKLKNSNCNLSKKISEEFQEYQSADLHSLTDLLDSYEGILKTSKKIFEETCLNTELYISLVDEESKTRFNKTQKEFRESYFDLKKHINILSSGIQGEKSTLNALKLYGDKIEIIQSLCTRIGEDVYEHDFIVINEYGIFSIEVKNNSNYEVYISEQGICNGKNLIKQSKQHFHSLRRCLEDTEYSKAQIHTLIVFTNDKNTVKSEQNTIPICYRYNIDDVIFDSSRYKKCINKKEFKNIKKVIEEKCKYNQMKYTLDFNLDYYISKLSDIILKENIKQLEELKRKFHESDGELLSLGLKTFFVGIKLLDNLLEG